MTAASQCDQAFEIKPAFQFPYSGKLRLPRRDDEQKAAPHLASRHVAAGRFGLT
jgi:hypothetical protein